MRLVGAVVLLSILYRAWTCLDTLAGALTGGTIAGLCYFGAALHWLGSSANPDPDTFIIREAAMTLGSMGLFVPWWALWWVGARLLCRASPRQAPLAYVLAFGLANLLLGDVAMGIPMVPLSLFALDTPIANLLAWTGQFGLDTLLVASSAVLGTVRLVDRRGRAQLLAAGVGAVAVTAFASMGLTTQSDRDLQAIDAPIYLAQPSLPHVSLMPPEEVSSIVRAALLTEIERGIAAGAQLIVLPEGAFLDDLTGDTTIPAEIASLLPQNSIVAAGFHRAAVETTLDGGFAVTPYNSVMLIGADGPLAVHDKAHLVPFGETMPALFFSLGFDVIAGPSGGFGSGPAIGVFEDVGSLPPFALLICYEGILSGAVVREVGDARWLLNVSSETLFRGTAGPGLLLEHMRLRSLETGLPMLRSTAHAYSAVILPDGSLSDQLDPEVAGGMIVSVPEARPTVFLRQGYWPLWVALGWLAACLALGFQESRRKNSVEMASSSL